MGPQKGIPMVPYWGLFFGLHTTAWAPSLEILPDTPYKMLHLFPSQVAIDSCIVAIFSIVPFAAAGIVSIGCEVALRELLV